MTSPSSERLFELGQLKATPKVLQSIHDSGQDISEFLNRHIRGDWGTLSEVDRLNNDAAVATGDRLYSVYRTGNGTKIWIITEPENESGERFLTTVVLPSEY